MTDTRFELDRFQVDAIAALDRGVSVLVAAPTGSGKTVVAEHAVSLALARGRRVFYTAPIKALSNQKYHDLRVLHGASQVGLLTGDNVINGDAPVVVMTTEVLRNMIYAGTDLSDLDYVVLDEVHYLQDTYRGPVWEEVIIHLPIHARLVCLSATVSNAEQLTEWITLVRGPTEVVVEHERPIHLDNLLMATERPSDRLAVLPVLVGGRANPEGAKLDTTVAGGRGPRGRPRSRFATPRRVEVIDELSRRDLLPAIVFVFSRAGCDEAATSCLNAGVVLTTPDERARIRAVITERVAGLSPGELSVLGYHRWLAAMEAGLAAHHAGMVPPFKEAVEACFVQGLVKVVFATETLALGINMPARTVVIEKLSKFTGERHEFLTPGEYTQLTGRAGRRGIDAEGRAVVLWSPFVSFEEVANLASSRSFHLRSAFRPTYNMAANLVARYDRDGAYRLLNRSFAQYQADQSIVTLERRLAERRDDLARLEGATPVDAAELRDYMSLRRAARQAATPDQAARRAIETAVGRLVPGTVIRVAGEAVAVLSVAQRRHGSLLRAANSRGELVTVRAEDFLDPPVRLGAISLPQPFQPRHRGYQQEVARRLDRSGLHAGGRGRGRRGSRGKAYRRVGDPEGSPTSGADVGPAEEAAALHQAEVEGHALHHHPDRDHLLRLAFRLERTTNEVGDLTKRVDGAVDTVARRFARLLELMEDRGFVHGWSLTERGHLLARCYHECDLLVAECLSDGLLDDLDPPILAALVSCFTYEHRSRTLPPRAWLPSAEARSRYRAIQHRADRLQRQEELAHLTPTRTPEATFAALAHAWASGGDLDALLSEGGISGGDVSGGDFVRNVKQLVDLLRQIGEIAPDRATARTARQAADALFRGVVSASVGIEEPPAGPL